MRTGNGDPDETLAPVRNEAQRDEPSPKSPVRPLPTSTFMTGLSVERAASARESGRSMEGCKTMMNRIRIVGIALGAGGLAVVGAGFLYGLPQANDGLDSAQAMYEAQGVRLSYNDDGQLIDRGTTEGAQSIMALLEKVFKYPVNHADFDPNDALVNTRSELMYEYATITYHVLHTSVAVTLTAADVPITYRDVTYTERGTYNITLEHYYAHLDRTNPIERQLREAWSPLALTLTSALAGAHANHAAGELARATTLGIGGIGLLFVGAGGGLVWASFGRNAQGSPGS